MAVTLKYSIDKTDITQALNTLKMCQLTKRKQRRILGNVGRAIRKDARKNVSGQKTINGQAFAKRKNKKNRKKMLVKLGKELQEFVHADRVNIGYTNSAVAKTGYRHQYGTPEQFTKRKLKRIRKKTDGSRDDPATRQQAKALRKMGYTVPKKRGKGEKTPGVKWIVENLNQGKAGLLIRELSNRKTRTRWEITTEPRPYLGLTEFEAQQLLTNEILKVMNR